MHHLKRGTKDGSTQIRGWDTKATSETGQPSLEIASLWDNRHLVLVVSDDLSQLSLNKLRSGRLSTKSGQNICGLLKIAFLDEITRGFWQEEETDAENKSPKHLNCNWNTIRASIEPVLSAIVDAGCEQDSDGNAKLVSRHEGASNLSWGNLGHVEDNDSRDETDSKASNQTASNEKAESSGGSLEDNLTPCQLFSLGKMGQWATYTNQEDNAANDDGCSSTNPICDITSHNSTEECTGRENRGDERFLPCWERESIGLSLGCIGTRIRKALVEMDEVPDWISIRLREGGQ